jgi:hypothetical protein
MPLLLATMQTALTTDEVRRRIEALTDRRGGREPVFLGSVSAEAFELIRRAGPGRRNRNTLKPNVYGSIRPGGKGGTVVRLVMRWPWLGIVLAIAVLAVGTFVHPAIGAAWAAIGLTAFYADAYHAKAVIAEALRAG